MFWRRVSWVIAGVLAVALLANFARVVAGGPLDPTGPPAPTMLGLDEVLPSWHQNLSSSGADPCDSERFTCVLGDEAVLDRETGIVWERIITGAATTWYGAFNTCVGRGTGGETGWRLPEIEELMSLATVGQSGPSLPMGHPFDAGTLAEEGFWSATPDWETATHAHGFDLSTGTDFALDQDFSLFTRCVRGQGGVRG